MGTQNMLIAYAIKESAGKTHWLRIGVAFVNKDDSINVKLDAVPVNGELQLRKYEPPEDGGDRGGRNDDRGRGGFGGRR